MDNNPIPLQSVYLLKGKTIPNRFVAQAMEINTAGNGGSVSEGVIKRYNELAEGNWGIVFIEATSITDAHLARQNGLVLNKTNLDGFKRLVDEFKSINDKSQLLIQLTHSGRQSGSFSQKVKVYDDEQSDIPVLNESELDDIKEQFTEAIQLACQSGMDGVDVKACHGYLGGEFLRPLNKRSDKYGGSIENRTRFISDLIAVAKDQRPDFIVGSRISVFEGIRGGCGTANENEVIEDFAEMLEILTRFVDAGADYINVSGGIPTKTPLLTRPLKNGDFYRISHYRYTKLIKQVLSQAAVIGSTYTTGDETCLSLAQENIEKGYTDFAGFGRQNLADPMFPVKAFEDPETIDYCTLCGKCSRLLKDDRNIYCQTQHESNPYL